MSAKKANSINLTMSKKDNASTQKSSAATGLLHLLFNYVRVVVRLAMATLVVFIIVLVVAVVSVSVSVVLDIVSV